MNNKVKLTSELIYGFTETFLKPQYDDPQPTPEFHKELWDLFCIDHKYAAACAPRGHAKSTATTHAFALACVLFRVKKYVLLVSDTESQAAEFLGDIKRELQENENLIVTFGIKKFVTEKETDIVVEFEDGYRFRILARGSEQKVRGRKWRNTRPDLILGDDLENDEIVMNDDRREKFRRWFYNALLPAGSKYCWVRIVGTILHMDSLLSRIVVNEETPGAIIEPLKITAPRTLETVWHSVFWRAHPSIDDFSHILWPENFPEERLRQERQHYINEGFPDGYSQEYLNRPIDDSSAYFRLENMRDLENRTDYLEYYATADLAISEKKQRADTVIAVGGMNSRGTLKIVDIRTLHTDDSFEIINALIEIYETYKPKVFGIEQENIAKAIGAPLVKECSLVDCDLPYVIQELKPDQDKIRRTRAFQYMVRAGKVEFDHSASWWDIARQQLVYFPRGHKKDIVDALAWLGILIKEMDQAPTESDLEIQKAIQELEESYNEELDYEDELERWANQEDGDPGEEILRRLREHYKPASAGVGYYTGY